FGDDLGYKKLILTRISALFWSIWLTRNEVIFRGTLWFRGFQIYISLIVAFRSPILVRLASDGFLKLSSTWHA
ncbi:hypothetical protein ACJX0J_041881, partial [Zea mays]